MDLVRKKHQSIGCIVPVLLQFWRIVGAILLDLVWHSVSLDADDVEKEAVNGSTTS